VVAYFCAISLKITTSARSLVVIFSDLKKWQAKNSRFNHKLCDVANDLRVDV